MWPDPIYYRWDPYRDLEMPEDGTTGYMGSKWRPCGAEDADVIEVPYTVWGDYVGSTVERSNYRSLVEDYPDTFIEISGGYWSHVLYIRPERLNATEGLVEAIEGLFDYPLYNEDDHSQLEMDIAWEAWDAYLRSDIERDDIPEHLCSEDWSDEDWEFFRQEYYRLTYEQNYGPEMEGADSCDFPFHDQVIEQLIREIETLGFEHDPRRPNPNQLTMGVDN